MPENKELDYDPYDWKGLMAEAKLAGLDIAEETAVRFVQVALVWAQYSATKKGGFLSQMILMNLPYARSKVNDWIDRWDGKDNRDEHGRIK